MASCSIVCLTTVHCSRWVMLPRNDELITFMLTQKALVSLFLPFKLIFSVFQKPHIIWEYFKKLVEKQSQRTIFWYKNFWNLCIVSHKAHSSLTFTQHFLCTRIYCNFTNIRAFETKGISKRSWRWNYKINLF